MKGSLLLYNLKLNCFIFFVYQSKQLTDYIYTDIYTVNIEMHWTDSLFVWTLSCFFINLSENNAFCTKFALFLRCIRSIELRPLNSPLHQSSRSSTLIGLLLKNPSKVLVTVSSKSMSKLICNQFHARVR